VEVHAEPWDLVVGHALHRTVEELEESSYVCIDQKKLQCNFFGINVVWVQLMCWLEKANAWTNKILREQLKLDQLKQQMVVEIVVVWQWVLQLQNLLIWKQLQKQPDYVKRASALVELQLRSPSKLTTA
jgi:hypothetical protein